MKSAFVTGGTGFIGSHLVEELLRRGYTDVRCLVRKSSKWLQGLPVNEIRGDVFSEEAMRSGLAEVDYVYHVAGITRATDWQAFLETNVLATKRLVELVAETNPSVKKVLVTSSLAAVGRCESGVATEEDELRPVSRYGRSKAAMEMALAGYLPGLPLVIIRPPAVYGPREADIYTFFKTLTKRICPVVGDVLTPVLSLVHVRDLVRGMVDAAEAPNTAGETYFLGSETFYSWKEVKDAATAALGHRALTIAVPPVLVGAVGAVVELAGRLTGSYPPLNREKAREIRHTCKRCSIEKARRDFGYKSKIPLDQGMKETIDWYRHEGWL